MIKYTIKICTLVAALLSTACYNEPPPALRISINTWPGYEFLYLAQEKGFFKEAGVDVKLVEFNSLGDARLAYERHQVDGLACTLVEVLIAQDASDRHPQIVYGVDASEGADVIYAQKSITSLDQLRGKTIGYESSSLGVYMLSKALDSAGLTLADVKLLPLDPMTIRDKFISGAIDAAVTYAPFSIEINRATQLEPIFSSKAIPGEIIDVLAFDKTIIENREEDIYRVLTAFEKARSYAAQNSAESYAIMAAREGITVAEFTSALNTGLRIFDAKDQIHYFAEGMLLKVLSGTQNSLFATQQIEQKLDPATFINTAPLSHLINLKVP